MDLAKNIGMVVYIIVCLILIVLVMKQSKEDEGASATIVGNSSNSFYEKNKGRTKEGRMKRGTIILGIVFIILTIALGILYAM